MGLWPALSLPPAAITGRVGTQTGVLRTVHHLRRGLRSEARGGWCVMGVESEVWRQKPEEGSGAAGGGNLKGPHTPGRQGKRRVESLERRGADARRMGIFGRPQVPARLSHLSRVTDMRP